LVSLCATLATAAPTAHAAFLDYRTDLYTATVDTNQTGPVRRSGTLVDDDSFRLTVVDVPEPATFALALAGLAGVVLARRAVLRA
jgi:hypothetical protein